MDKETKRSNENHKAKNNIKQVINQTINIHELIF